MASLLTTVWPAVLAGFVLGTLVGVMAGLPADRGALVAALVLVAAALGLGGLAVVGTLVERPGLWLEVSVLILGAYLAGCLIGGFGRAVSRRGSARPRSEAA